MASFIYGAGVFGTWTGAIDSDTDTFKMMLTTSTYTPNKTTHLKRSAVTNEVTGSGYTAGGNVCAVTVTNDTANTRVVIGFGAVEWPTSTLTARYAVIYKSRGGANTADELVALIDFSANVSSASSTFPVTASTLHIPY